MKKGENIVCKSQGRTERCLRDKWVDGSRSLGEKLRLDGSVGSWYTGSLETTPCLGTR